MSNEELAPLIRAKLAEFQELVNQLEGVDVYIIQRKHQIDSVTNSYCHHMFEVQMTETKTL